MDGTDINVADLNGDDVEDLVVSIALNGSYTAVLLGNGDGTFRSPSIITELLTPATITAAALVVMIVDQGAN